VALKPTNLRERYELKEVLGRGGMGVVYKAYDTVMKREVALKTLLDVDNPATMQLFYKEWSILATMVHPNIVNIYDIGEMQQGAVRQPFFVMPLLPGVTLEHLIKEASPRLTVTGTLEIVEQACRGLHAAHEQGLVHRDVKPSNIFVMDDNSVKIIDFGIARQATGTKTAIKGTLYYLAPEQLQLQPPTPLSDLFALGVVTYEALTRQRPFTGASESDVVESILHHSPPPVCEINHEVSHLISQVIHKALAKQPWHRFFNMREFADSLQKALRNEPLECFDTSKIKPRLERAAASFAEGDYVFASEILAELEAEGHLDQEVRMLRRQVDEAVRQTHIRQMLTSARRFFEATEYPLALRKIQEALQLDPEDTDALSLKEQVEKERRKRKISEWITIGRQHLDNGAFRQAREALENVVTVKPNDTEALRLLEEVGRREQEVSRIREEKSRLYQAAMHAWEKGEVTAALSRMEVLIAMDRDHPESDQGRSSTYQNFFNQVHSEHNALKNAYEEARRSLTNDNFEAALAICRQYLAKYPNHALFQALQFDVEERRRQKLSAVIAETDRRVEAEPDLDKRAAILEEAVRLYPGESHFERAQRLVRDKRDLVNSIVAKARFFEDRGQFNDALDQWQILRSIHDKQPGLEFEIQRLMKRRNQQAHEHTKARWVEQVDKYLENGDYERASQTVGSALAEFPGEAELLELEKLVRKNQESARQALDSLDRAHALNEKGDSEGALGALREANQLDPRNAVVRTVLLNSLLDRARRLVDSDWEAAEAAVREVLEREPKHALAQSLATRIGDRKRDEAISWYLSQSRRLQTDGDLVGAMAVAAQGLAAYPNEPRLQQLHATLQRAKVEADRQTTRSRETLEVKLQKLEVPENTPAAPPPAPPAAPEAAPVPKALTPLPAPVVTPQPAAELPPLNEPVLPVEAPTPIPVTPAPVQPVATPPSRQLVAPTLLHNRILQGAAAFVAVVALMIGGVVLFNRHKASNPIAPPVAAKFKIQLTTSPEGAGIRVNGEPCGQSACDLELTAGSYSAEARMEGYEPATLTFHAGPEVDPSSPVVLNLRPLTPRLTISTDLAEGAVQVDDVVAGQIASGKAEFDNLAPGRHEISVKGGNSSANFALEIAPGQLPVVDGQVVVTNLRAFVLTAYGSEGRLSGSMTGFRVTLDGKLIGNLGPSGLSLSGLGAGSHELVLDGPTGQHDTTVFDVQPNGGVYLLMLSGANMGVLDITANVDQAAVFIDGIKYQRPTSRGRLQIYLPPKKYSIRVEQDGYAAPAEQAVAIQAFQSSKADFKLAAIKAVLLIHHAPPVSEVLLDGNRVGVTRADGEFSLANIEPGKHSVQVRHDQFKPLQADQTFTAGITVELDAPLESLLGTLHIDATPPDARILLRKDGETKDQIITGRTAALPEGGYTITASAPHFQDASASFRITANHTVNAVVVLKPATGAKAPAPPAPQIFSLADWLKEGGWTVFNGNALTRRGGDLVVAPVDFTQANIHFTILSVKGKRTEWVVAFRDPKNYYLCELDDRNFIRTIVTDGGRMELVKIPHGINRKALVGVNIDISPESIVTSVQGVAGWVTIDKWTFPEGSIHGRFGFDIPGKDEVELREFALKH
jgi:serine/threonine-protein kinase